MNSGAGAVEELGPQPVAQILGQRRVADQRSGVPAGRCGSCSPRARGGGSPRPCGGMADLQLQIPQDVEHRSRSRFRPRGSSSTGSGTAGRRRNAAPSRRGRSRRPQARRCARPRSGWRSGCRTVVASAKRVSDDGIGQRSLGAHRGARGARVAARGRAAIGPATARGALPPVTARRRRGRHVAVVAAVAIGSAQAAPRTAAASNSRCPASVRAGRSVPARGRRAAGRAGVRSPRRRSFSGPDQ